LGKLKHIGFRLVKQHQNGFANAHAGMKLKYFGVSLQAGILKVVGALGET
jgi:hypothetical protein